MSTTKEASERSMEARLGQAGRRIDGIVAEARHAQDNGKEWIGRRQGMDRPAGRLAPSPRGLDADPATRAVRGGSGCLGPICRGAGPGA
jgi:hypothetical protein